MMTNPNSVTTRALFTRINRKLAHEGRRLYKSRGKIFESGDGSYYDPEHYLVDDDGCVEDIHVDIVKLGRELGVLGDDEYVVESVRSQRAMSTPDPKDGSRYIRRSHLIKRGWTDTAIRRLLGTPDHVVGSGAPVTHLYQRERASAAEATDEWKGIADRAFVRRSRPRFAQLRRRREEEARRQAIEEERIARQRAWEVQRRAEEESLKARKAGNARRREELMERIDDLAIVLPAHHLVTQMKVSADCHPESLHKAIRGFIHKNLRFVAEGIEPATYEEMFNLKELYKHTGHEKLSRLRAYIDDAVSLAFPWLADLESPPLHLTNHHKPCGEPAALNPNNEGVSQ